MKRGAEASCLVVAFPIKVERGTDTQIEIIRAGQLDGSRKCNYEAEDDGNGKDGIIMVDNEERKNQ